MYLQETINHQKRKFTSFTKIQISNSSFLQYDYYRNAETCMCNASTGGRPPLQFHYSISNIYRVWCVHLALQGSYMLLLLWVGIHGCRNCIYDRKIYDSVVDLLMKLAQFWYFGHVSKSLVAKSTTAMNPNPELRSTLELKTGQTE